MYSLYEDNKSWKLRDWMLITEKFMLLTKLQI